MTATRRSIQSAHDVDATPQLVVVPPPVRVGLSAGEQVTVFAVVFFATVAVGMWAASVHFEGAFAMGLGWCLVLQRAYRWAQELERDIEPEAPTKRIEDPRPSAVVTTPAGYAARHDLRDLATLPCRYGCADPATCLYTHVGCSHCKQARGGR